MKLSVYLPLLLLSLVRVQMLHSDDKVQSNNYRYSCLSGKVAIATVIRNSNRRNTELRFALTFNFNDQGTKRCSNTRQED
ncbi:unnamed protein product [Brugia pahangi]|uniref:ZP domain-containing protein n=1 Tax=Brugia pahangi TaxID=6280 RepID=A0A0N4TJH9_BRUPA|nr:unnamed protein product [Brugia pahangi]